MFCLSNGFYHKWKYEQRMLSVDVVTSLTFIKMEAVYLHNVNPFKCSDSVSVYSDVISIEKTGEHFRLIYDVKGRFTVHRITAEEAKVRCVASKKCL